MAPKSELKKALRLAEKQLDEQSKKLETVLDYVKSLEGRKTVASTTTPYWEPVYEDFVASPNRNGKVEAIKRATEMARAKEEVDKIRSQSMKLTLDIVEDLAYKSVISSVDSVPTSHQFEWLRSKMYSEMRQAGYPPARVRRVLYPGTRTAAERVLQRKLTSVINTALADDANRKLKTWGEEMRKAVSQLRQNNGGKITLDGNGLPTYTLPPPEIPQDIFAELFKPTGKRNSPNRPPSLFDNAFQNAAPLDPQTGWG